MSCHLESKSSGAFNFIKKIALRIAHYQPYLIIKTTNMWRHRPDVNDDEKKKTQMEAMWYM